MKFRILGPLTVVDEVGEVIPLPALRIRTLLAALLCWADHAVTSDALIDAVWGSDPPRTAAKNLQVNIHQLRRRLGHERIVRHPHGYQLIVETGEVDADVFGALAEQGHQAIAAGDAELAQDLLTRALDLWRGNPFADIPDFDPGRELSARLVERRWLAIEDRFDAGLTLGRYSHVAAEVAPYIRENPLRERLRSAHMWALFRSGRQAEALQSYRDARRQLVEDLGIEPSPALQQLFKSILAGDTTGRDAPADSTTAAARPVAARAGVSGVSQLPLDVRGFAGRAAELAQLTDAIGATPDRAGVYVITGAPGIGKTTLAVHLAHTMVGAFPDGQVYVDLHGSGSTSAEVSPEDALGRMLGAFGVQPRRRPTDLDAQAALFRAVLAGRRVVIILDNARNSAHVRPLLPGAPGCVVLVTSRNNLTGLVASSGAEHVALDVLDPFEARHLLAGRLGDDRVATEPEAVDDLVAMSAGLPLALAVLAARAAAGGRRHPLSAVVRELRDEHVLDALATDDDRTDVRAVFSWSYQRLSPDAARLFRLLSLAPEGLLSTRAVASLAGRQPAATRPALTELTDAHLVVEHRPGLYGTHDLLRRFARERLLADEAGGIRESAVVRLLNHYLRAAHLADRWIDPNRDQVDLLPQLPEVTVADPGDPAAAMAWLDRELPALTAAMEIAATAGLHSYVWQLAWTLAPYLDRRGRRQAWVSTQRAGLDAAVAADDTAAQALCERLLGAALCRSGDLQEALEHLGTALRLYETLGDKPRLATTHINMTAVLEQQDRVSEALEHSTAALALFRAGASATPHAGEAEALNAMGWEHSLLGDHQAALTYCTEALGILDAIGDRIKQAATWDSVGYAHHHLGEYRQAIEAYQHALDLYREFGDRYFYAVVLTHLAETYSAVEQPHDTQKALREALSIMEELEHPGAPEVRERLDSLQGDEHDDRASGS
ncbi:BTAD domain-containing putative transcriptional regulator [Micromonospora musae]|uniref:AfsR/SARP family transcriptional regulator n=1 Tax=Micromonospora musae TaxID=1894970 RepID=UPI00342629B3